MRNVNEKIPGITNMPIRVYELLKLKLTPENELDEDLVRYSNILDEIKKSKSGWIKIKKISDNGGYLTSVTENQVYADDFNVKEYYRLKSEKKHHSHQNNLTLY